MKKIIKAMAICMILISAILMVGCDTNYFESHVTVNTVGSYSSTNKDNYYAFINSQTNSVQTEYSRYKLTIEESKKNSDCEYKFITDMLVEFSNFKVSKYLSETIVSYKAVNDKDWTEVSKYSLFLNDGYLYFNGTIGVQKEDNSFETKSFMIKQNRISVDSSGNNVLIFSNFEEVMKQMEFDYYLGEIDEKIFNESVTIFVSPESITKYKFLQGTTPNTTTCVAVFSNSKLNGINYVQTSMADSYQITTTYNIISSDEEFQTPSEESYSAKPVNWPTNLYGLFLNEEKE